MTIKVHSRVLGYPNDPAVVTINGLNCVALLIGSEYINGKPGRDRDILAVHHAHEGPLTPEQVEAVGFTVTSEPELYPDSSEFFTARKDEFNLIACTSWDFFTRYLQAAKACRTVVLYTGQDMDKGLRVALHRQIADQETIEDSVAVGREVQERQA